MKSLPPLAAWLACAGVGTSATSPMSTTTWPKACLRNKTMKKLEQNEEDRTIFGSGMMVLSQSFCPILLGIILLLSVASHAEPPSVPFPFDWSKVNESQIDLSRFLDGPAGKHGLVRAKGESFVTENGKPIRFWGVNLAIDVTFAPKAMAADLADDLARWGVNLVRFHHLDTDWGMSLFDLKRDDTRHFDAEYLDRFDHLVAELKKRGIYVQLTLNVHRKFKAGDGVRDWKILGIGKGATFFNPRLIELQHEFTRKLLSHRNPYTGLTYANDPAIAFIELLNENSLIEAWAGWRLRPGVEKGGQGTWQPIPDSYARELDELYYDWLREHATEEQRRAITEETGVRFDQRPDPVPTHLRTTPNDFTKVSAERFRAEADFLMSVEADFFKAYRRLIRDELGSRALLTLSNDHADRISGYPHLQANLMGDWIDGHGYWQHPSIGKETRTGNTPMVNVPLDSTVVQFSRSVAQGRPFTIGETGHPFPHRHAAEGYPILTAYGQLQGWDSISWFSWKRGRLAPPDEGIARNGWFDHSTDSMKLAQLATCALMWHRGDVRASSTVHLRHYSPDEIRQSVRLWDEAPFFKPGYDFSLPLKQTVRFSFDPNANPSPMNVEGTPRRPWEKPASIESDTRELTWSHADVGSGVVKIDTPRTCGLIGFVKQHWWQRSARTRHLEAEPQNDHCSLLLTTLDDQSIAQSGRLLLTATCRSANTGQTWRDDLQTLAEWGQGPITIVPVTGKVSLKGIQNARSVKAFPLTAEGRRESEPRQLTRNGSDWLLHLDQPTTWWEFEVKR